MGQNGCLFNLAVDPCEVTNLGDSYPEIRDYFIDRLERYQRETPEPLMLYIDKLNWSSMAPAVHCDDADFWCPYLEYEVVNFEERLTVEFLRIQGIYDEMDTELNAFNSMWNTIAVHNGILSMVAVFVMITLVALNYSQCGGYCMSTKGEHSPLLLN